MTLRCWSLFTVSTDDRQRARVSQQLWSTSIRSTRENNNVEAADEARDGGMVQGARITRPHRMHGVQRKMRPIVTDVSWSVCVSVCVCLSAGHDRESHKNGFTDRDAVFGLWTPIGPTNHVLCGSPDPQRKGHFGGPCHAAFRQNSVPTC